MVTLIAAGCMTVGVVAPAVGVSESNAAVGASVADVEQLSPAEYREAVLAGMEERASLLSGSRSGVERDSGSVLACIPVMNTFYCPLLGWSDDPTLPETMRDVIETTVSGEVDGDGPGYSETVRQLEAQGEGTLAAAVAEDVAVAIDSAGKALTDKMIMTGTKATPEFLEAFPDGASYLSCSVPASQSATDYELLPGASPRVGPVANVHLVTSTAATKQEKPNWCGPASVAFMARHDPVVGSKPEVSKKQSDWKTYLGTTPSGTSIDSIITQVNQRLTGWTNRVNGYAKFSISGWNNATWMSRLDTTIGTKRAPIINHPKLTSSNSSYFQAGDGTGGHFNVIAGYTKWSVNSADARIFEPYAGKGNYVAKFVFEPVGNLQKQNMANTKFQNIAY